MSPKKSPRESSREKPESTMFVQLGDYLKHERELKSLTQNQVGEAIGLAGSRISAIETGKGNPGIENLGRWLETLGLGPAAFGWRFERFCSGKTLTPVQSEAHVKEIVRTTFGEVLQELSDLVRKREDPGEQGEQRERGR